MLVVVLLLVAVAVWLLIAQPWRGSAEETSPPTDRPPSQSTADALPVPSSQATPDPSGTGAVEGTVVEGPTPSAGATPAAEACDAGDISVEAVASADTFTGDQKPQFSIALTNDGPDCTLNVGTSAQSFTVTSGDDVWWRSTDCQREPSDMVVLIAAGQTVSSAAPLEWDRTRSAVGTCGDTTRPVAPGGGASYHLSVEIGGIASTEPKQFLLY